MENRLAMNTYELYQDIKERCGGEIYIGVLGPVRTGKSTFIKRFMNEMVLPFMEDEHAKMRAQDELPQSGTGKTITTTEPKFIPKNAANIKLAEDVFNAVSAVPYEGYSYCDESGATAIETVTKKHSSSAIYDLSGRACNEAQRNRINIINGKKILNTQ